MRPRHVQITLINTQREKKRLGNMVWRYNEEKEGNNIIW